MEQQNQTISKVIRSTPWYVWLVVAATLIFAAFGAIAGVELFFNQPLEKDVTEQRPEETLQGSR